MNAVTTNSGGHYGQGGYRPFRRGWADGVRLLRLAILQFFWRQFGPR